MKKLKQSQFDKNFYGCPRCDWPLDPTTGEYEYTGGVTCSCGGFVPLPDPPKPKESMAPKEILTRAMELLSLDPDWVVNKPATVATKTLNILTAEYPKLKEHQAKDIIARAARKLRYAHTVQDHD